MRRADEYPNASIFVFLPCLVLMQNQFALERTTQATSKLSKSPPRLFILALQFADYIRACLLALMNIIMIDGTQLALQ
ncbi:uncharacterized protein PHALS_06094 [Plasmopara halstedii]|uniref:Uncharacterized protein n=1 Tax=Plasmopara halstedii TaxID=4781 RepID=A0A0P1B0Q1_PLAHL|nr:uncharacterized protein PHALS_06094 [Plasmopara halstedii]CEG48264.1 hypothetical protein PHALS_06094 [Plasmopara halstedii]|eukprot:XP_024584633.1 hypothetical protein PHALS_06094 [Plasmopara halstedii]